jgi:hypothetical protein
LDHRPLTQTQKRDWARARLEARPLARAALWWLEERIEELEETKVAAIQGDTIDIGRLAPAAREALRLRNLSPGAVLEAYLAAKMREPKYTARLVRLGQTWENACSAAVRALVAKIQREQEAEAKRAA